MSIMVCNLIVFFKVFEEYISRTSCYILVIYYFLNVVLAILPAVLAMKGSLSFWSFSLCSLNSALCIILTAYIIGKYCADNPQKT